MPKKQKTPKTEHKKSAVRKKSPSAERYEEKQDVGKIKLKAIEEREKRDVANCPIELAEPTQQNTTPNDPVPTRQNTTLNDHARRKDNVTTTPKEVINKLFALIEKRDNKAEAILKVYKIFDDHYKNLYERRSNGLNAFVNQAQDYEYHICRNLLVSYTSSLAVSSRGKKPHLDELEVHISAIQLLRALTKQIAKHLSSLELQTKTKADASQNTLAMQTIECTKNSWNSLKQERLDFLTKSWREETQAVIPNSISNVIMSTSLAALYYIISVTYMNYTLDKDASIIKTNCVLTLLKYTIHHTLNHLLRSKYFDLDEASCNSLSELATVMSDSNITFANLLYTFNYALDKDTHSVDFAKFTTGACTTILYNFAMSLVDKTFLPASLSKKSFEKSDSATVQGVYDQLLQDLQKMEKKIQKHSDPDVDFRDTTAVVSGRAGTSYAQAM